VPHEFSATATIDRPIDEVFAFLAAGTNDPKFSPRVIEIDKATDGPVGVGTVFASKVKDAGMTTSRRFELTEFEPQKLIRWVERSKNIVTVATGGYDLEAAGDGATKVTIHNELVGHGFGKVIVGFATKAAIKDGPALAQRIKAAIESQQASSESVPPG
jgi:Polyketide cyclase / dehydrase and lipid transport